MTNTKEDKLTMYYTVQEVCNKNNTIWNVLPAFVTSFAAYETNISKIETTLGIQNKQITGVSKDKEKLRDEMIDKTFLVSGAKVSYASTINDQTLLTKAKIRKSDAKNLRDTIQLEQAKSMHKLADDLGTLLADYGITTTVLEDLLSKIEGYAEVIVAPRIAITTKKGATENIANLFLNTLEILNNRMDTLMEQFKENEPTFYNLYFHARNIIDTGRHTSLTAKTINATENKEV
mgnify:CR=1 FL=1